MEEEERGERPKVEAVITGKVIRRKPPLGQRFIETFFAGQAEGLGGHLLIDIVVPMAKDMLRNVVMQGLDQILSPKDEQYRSNDRPGFRPQPTPARTSYNRMSGSTPPWSREEPRQVPRSVRANHEFDTIILPDRAAAQKVLDTMRDRLARYESVSVQEFYSMMDVTGDWTDNRWGWTEIGNPEIRWVRGGGYVLDLPKPERFTA